MGSVSRDSVIRILYDLRKKKGITLAVLGSGYNPGVINGDIRCDLHPRWNRNGTAISFDSIHENHRHVYWMDLSSVISR